MSTKIDLQLGAKTDVLTGGLGEKSPPPNEDSADFRQVLDEAVSSRPATDKKDNGKKLPKVEYKPSDIPLDTDNVIQKSLESNRMIITTESSGSLEEFETFAAKQGLASSSLKNLLENENISKSTLYETDEPNTSPFLNLAERQGDVGNFKQISTEKSKNLTEPRSFNADKTFDGQGKLFFKSDTQNVSEKLTLKNIERENFPFKSKISLISQNEKLQFQQNSVTNLTNVGVSTEQSPETKELDKRQIDQIIINKHLKIKGEDVVIKSVVLDKNNLVKKHDSVPLKLDSIDLGDDFLGLFERDNKFTSATSSLKSTSGESSVGKLTSYHQSQYFAPSELTQNPSNELKGKIEEHPNNLSRFNQIQNMTAKFADSLVNRLTSQINKGAWRIEMEMHPRSLGKVSVQMEMVNGNLEAQFFTNQNLTRDLILESVPRLREMLENNGTNNAQVSVELKNDGNNDRENFFSEINKQKFDETDDKIDEDTSNGSVNSETPGRYDFLV